MNTILAEIIFLAVLILLNGVFSMSEIAVISSREARLRLRAEAGSAGARTALELAASPGRFLPTIQVGVTLVGILAGASSGAAIAAVLAESLRNVPLLAPYAGPLALGAVVVAITYLTLVFGELAPKRLALNNPEAVSTAIARPMYLLSRVGAPLVRLLSLSTDAVLALLRVRPPEGPAVTEEEIALLIKRGGQAGVLDAAEQDMAERIFGLDDIRISRLMTPRTEIAWLDVNDPPEQNWRKIIESERSTFPVCDGTLDRTLGVASVKRLWAQHVAGQPHDLRAALTDPVFVPESTRALSAFKQIKEAGGKLALVIDEFGGVEGMVTLNDMLEAIVGDIQEEDEEPAPQAVQRADGSWLVDGRLPASDLKDLFGLAALPGEESSGFDTVGGFVMMRLERVPRETDWFELGSLRFEVVDMDGHRVDKVLVTWASGSRPAEEG
jgi:putative hemolysin